LKVGRRGEGHAGALGSGPDESLALFVREVEGIGEDLDGVRMGSLPFATHQGELMGIAPTGNRVTFTGIAIARIEDGKVAEIWENYDALGMMQQLGVIPSPA